METSSYSSKVQISHPYSFVKKFIKTWGPVMRQVCFCYDLTVSNMQKVMQCQKVMKMYQSVTADKLLMTRKISLLVYYANTQNRYMYMQLHVALNMPPYNVQWIHFFNVISCCFVLVFKIFNNNEYPTGVQLMFNVRLKANVQYILYSYIFLTSS